MNLGAIEFRHLRYFAAVVEYRGFRAAAQALHVSQPPLTRQVQQLEELLGVELLVRKARGVELTEAGAVLYEEAKNLLMLGEQAIDRTRLASYGQLGRLDVGVYGSAVLDVVPRVIKRFRTLHPQVEVVLHNLDRTAQIKALRERRLTVGFNRFFVEEPGLVWERILTENVHVAMPSGHRLAKRKEIGLRELGGESVILYPRAPRPGWIDQTMRFFQERNIKLESSQEVDDIMTAIALVSVGIGLALVVDSARNLQLPDVVYVPLQKLENIRIDLSVIHREADASPLLRTFLAVAKSIKG